ncbi:MAG: sigma-54 dependent transcriptional regulator [Dehalococcoidales bacterium]|nr:sigma-54 dependent transcriptional regulator [Dehalococcoidales bacterium]
MQKTTKIVIVDDEEIIRNSFSDWLRDLGYRVFEAGTGIESLKIIKDEKPNIAIVDLIMPGMDGVEVLKRAKEIYPGIEVIIMTAYGSIPTAVNAVRAGACDFIEKPFCPEKVEILIEKIIEHKKVVEENILLRQKLDERCNFENIIYKSAKMQRVVELVRAVSKSNANVLITGESGTGKELIARAVHNYSHRQNKPFVAISCAALPETILESELFGHEKGSFTGAHIQRKGKFEIADNGTLFMDEIGDMSINIQVYLLRVLEEQEFTRVGGNDLVKVDVRIISATNKDLKESIAKGKFREDLYYRLNVVNIELPALRQRTEDIPLLAGYFLKKFAAENKKEVSGFAPKVMDFLLKYEWPGNVRELENAIERAVVLARNNVINTDDLPQQTLRSTDLITSKESIKDVEKKHIINVLKESGCNYSKAAAILGISRVTLYNKIKVYEIDVNKAAN